MRNYRLHRFDRYTTRNLQDASVQLLQISAYDSLSPATHKFYGKKSVQSVKSVVK